MIALIFNTYKRDLSNIQRKVSLKHVKIYLLILKIFRIQINQRLFFLATSWSLKYLNTYNKDSFNIHTMVTLKDAEIYIFISKIITFQIETA